VDEIVVRCRPKQFELLVIEVGLNILNWVPISNELLVVLKRVVATAGRIRILVISVNPFGSEIVGRATGRRSS